VDKEANVGVGPMPIVFSFMFMFVASGASWLVWLLCFIKTLTYLLTYLLT